MSSVVCYGVQSQFSVLTVCLCVQWLYLDTEWIKLQKIEKSYEMAGMKRPITSFPTRIFLSISFCLSECPLSTVCAGRFVAVPMILTSARWLCNRSPEDIIQKPGHTQLYSLSAKRNGVVPSVVVLVNTYTGGGMYATSCLHLYICSGTVDTETSLCGCFTRATKCLLVTSLAALTSCVS